MSARCTSWLVRILDRGVPSHWTAYVRVIDVDDVARRAVSYGGEVLVRPVVVPGVARIAVIVDSVGAHVGLWQPIGAHEKESAND